MALVPSRRRKGLGLKLEGGKPTTFGLEKMSLGNEHIPSTYLAHESDIPIVDGKRFIFDQQATSSCVANTFLGAIHLAEVRAGIPFIEGSRLYAYYNGRREHGGHLWDGGTYLRTCAHGLRKFGVCDEIHWEWSQWGTKVNRRPNWNAMRFSHSRRGGKYVRIYETGDDRIKAVQQAILNGHDVGFGTRLAKSFQDGKGAVLIDIPQPTEKIIGNHAMLIIGWQTFGEKLYFRVLNSWGDRWRDKGLCWMSANYIAWSHTQDLHVIYGWEALQ